MYAADTRHPRQSLEEKLSAIYDLRGGPSIDLTIRKPYLDLLEALGSPHKHLPPVIHVAGTNGKGSVTAMLRSIFEAAGYKVHVYTSPHLVRFNERIVLAGQEIEDDFLEGLLDKVLAANQGAPLTFFEITTALAFCAFAQVNADICLLETGLGGRLDCTNVIQKPLATVITRIGYDHMEFLGETLAAIAGEKAGIMKAGVPAVYGPQPDPAIDAVFAEKASAVGCSLYKADMGAALPPTNMTGPHQRGNVATALACLSQVKGFDVPQQAIEKGLMNVRWPARLQKLRWPDMPEGTELWIDGGHNESAAKALAAQARLWQEEDQKPLHIILGMMKTKDPRAFAAAILPYAQSVTCVNIEGEGKAFSANDLAQEIMSETTVPVLCARDVFIALDAEFSTGLQRRVLVTGSLYLAGQILAESQRQDMEREIKLDSGRSV